MTQETLIQAELLTRRPCSVGAERMIGRVFPVLDEGEVELLDYMGNDDQIIQSARVTSGTSSRAPKDDRGLLRYMMRHRHTSPFEMCELRLRMKLPIFVARQWIRHRTANVNEASYRYKEAPELAFLPALDSIGEQSKSNRQGRGDTLPPEAASKARKIMEDMHAMAHTAYRELLDLNVTRELARCVLPVAEYTEWIWKCDLHNLLHLEGLRLDPHAQAEIRAFAEAVATIIEEWVPETWSAWCDYRRDSLTLTRLEIQAAMRLNSNSSYANAPTLGEAAAMVGLVGRESDEAIVKLARLFPDHDRVVLQRRELDRQAAQAARLGDSPRPIAELLRILVEELWAMQPTTAIGPQTANEYGQELLAIAAHPMVVGHQIKASALRDMFIALSDMYQETGGLEQHPRCLVMATMLECPTLKSLWEVNFGERISEMALLVLRTGLHVHLDAGVRSRYSRELEWSTRWRRDKSVEAPGILGALGLRFQKEKP